ncbi:MAG: hypothetical protein M1818_007704 [Claussenomyces sp. TS43310]|nr:MAG: hypothetical protein M1818_007704 [Claussenomyces sp. TS43310]
MTTVILGCGIIGASTAYYLSQTQTPSSIHLVEPSPTLFASASGNAGGFLARDWFSPSLAELGALSFSEHRRLAEEHNGRDKWGYSRSTGTGYTAASKKTTSGERGDDWRREGTSRANAAKKGISELVDDGHGIKWLTRSAGDEIEVISSGGSTAQVDPLRLSQFLLSECLHRGVQLHHPATAISVTKDLRDELSSIRILSTDSATETDIPCTRLLISAGAWSPRVFRTLFPSAGTTLPITSLAGHSLVIRSPRWTQEHETAGCHAVFTTDDAGFSPELFSRLGGDIYVAGLNDASLPLPALPTDSKIEPDAIAQLQQTAKRLLSLPGEAQDLDVTRSALCFRPVTDRGTPILARFPDATLGPIRTRAGADGGVFAAAGHGPWGISHSLGTGKVMAEMMQGLPTSVDIRGLAL